MGEVLSLSAGLLAGLSGEGASLGTGRALDLGLVPKPVRRGSEWPGGIAPPGSLRTGREPLDSPGSHHPAAGLDKAGQWANSVGERLMTSRNHLYAFLGLRLRRLYFLMAHRTR